jgi:hypothetical protein
MFVRRAATLLFDRSDRSSCLAGSLRLSIIQFGSGRLNIADLSEVASDGLLELVRLVSGLRIVSEVVSSEGVGFFGGILDGCVGL